MVLYLALLPSPHATPPPTPTPPRQRHTTRFMVLYLALLPLALWAKCGWGTVPAVALISLALLTIGASGGAAGGRVRAGAVWGAD
jgi:hypothetical protein